MSFIYPLIFRVISVTVLKKQKPEETWMVWKETLSLILVLMFIYIGAITAFVVNQAQHIPLPPIVLWLSPAAILVPVIAVELKKVKSKPIEYSV